MSTRRGGKAISLNTPSQQRLKAWAPSALPRTGEYRLKKVLTKLDISFRKEMAGALAGMPDAGVSHLASAAADSGHFRVVEPATGGAYGEGPMCGMGVTFGVSIMRSACSCCALVASGATPGRAPVGVAPAVRPA